MTTITLELPDSLYQQLHRRSQQSNRPIEAELMRLLPPQLPPTTDLPELSLAYQEVIQFLGRGATAQEISTFYLSTAAQERAQWLISQNKIAQLTPSEKTELDLYVELENFIALIKTQALRQLQQQR